MEYINQKQMILDYIQINGRITVTDAVKDLGINALPARIRDLKRDGYNIVATTQKGKNRYGKSTIYTEYSIKCKE